MYLLSRLIVPHSNYIYLACAVKLLQFTSAPEFEKKKTKKSKNAQNVQTNLHSLCTHCIRELLFFVIPDLLSTLLSMPAVYISLLKNNTYAIVFIKR